MKTPVLSCGIQAKDDSGYDEDGGCKRKEVNKF